jgi:hypothetical protein
MRIIYAIEEYEMSYMKESRSGRNFDGWSSPLINLYENYDTFKLEVWLFVVGKLFGNFKLLTILFFRLRVRRKIELENLILGYIFVTFIKLKKLY